MGRWQLRESIVIAGGVLYVLRPCGVADAKQEPCAFFGFHFLRHCDCDDCGATWLEILRNILIRGLLSTSRHAFGSNWCKTRGNRFVLNIKNGVHTYKSEKDNCNWKDRPRPRSFTFFYYAAAVRSITHFLVYFSPFHHWNFIGLCLKYIPRKQ